MNEGQPSQAPGPSQFQQRNQFLPPPGPDCTDDARLLEHRLTQIENKIDALDKKFDSFVDYMKNMFDQNHLIPRNNLKIEPDSKFVAPELPIHTSQALRDLDHVCRADTYYMEQMVLLLHCEASAILLDSKCEKKMVRGFMEILFSYDLLDTYSLTGVAGFNGDKSKGSFRDMYGLYSLFYQTMNYDTKIPYSEKQVNDAIKTFFKYFKVNKKRYFDRQLRNAARYGPPVINPNPEPVVKFEQLQ